MEMWKVRKTPPKIAILLKSEQRIASFSFSVSWQDTMHSREGGVLSLGEPFLLQEYIL